MSKLCKSNNFVDIRKRRIFTNVNFIYKIKKIGRDSSEKTVIKKIII